MISALLIFVLSGCFDYEEEIWVNKDNSAHGEFTLTLSEEAAALKELGQAFSGETLKRRMQEYESIELLQYEEKQAGSDTVVHFQVRADTFKHLLDFIAATREGSQSVTIINEENVTRFRRQLAAANLQKNSQSSDDGFWSRLAAGVTEAAIINEMSKRTWTSTIHFANGLISANSAEKDATTVRWTFRMNRLWMEDVVMTATYQRSPKWLALTSNGKVLGVLVLALFLVVVVVGLIKLLKN